MPVDRPHASALAGVWPLTGRDQELEAIGAARADPLCGGVVVIAGPGVGKSRLAREAHSTAALEGAFTSWVQATRSAASVPLAAVVDLVPDAVRSADLVDLLKGCGQLLRERANGRPVVLGVDDAHLLDPASAALVLHLATSSAAFVLVTVRAGAVCPDAVVSLWKDDSARRLELGALSDESVRELVESALGDPVEERAMEWLIAVSRGNALYVRELVRGAVDTGALIHSPGFWRLTKPMIACPSLVDLVAQRTAALSPDHRRAVELLALGEPLALDEVSALTSEEALLEAEAHGLIVTTSDEVRLAHPLYGEAVRGTLPPLRSRSLRLTLVATLEARTTFGPDDALRAARLRLDAGAHLSPGQALAAARAANRAGDPDFGAELAELANAGGDLAAAMQLARAQMMRNHYEEAEATLATAEPLAPEHPSARDYVRQRLWLGQWGLRRPTDASAFLERAENWSEDPNWRGFIARIGLTYGALGDGLGAPPKPSAQGSDHDIPDSTRRGIETLQRMSAFFDGDGDAAAAAAFAERPAVPLRDDADAGALAALGLIAIDSGYRWRELEQYMSEVIRAAVRGRDHCAAGLAAFATARLHFLRGRYRDCARWLAEAEVHCGHEDPFNAMLGVRVLQVGTAFFTGDFDATMIALEQMRSWSHDHRPLPAQRVPVRRAEGWALRMRNVHAAGVQLLEDAAELAEEMPGLAPQLAYDALRVGAPAAVQLERMAARCHSRMVSAYARHASAKLARDGEALMAAAEEMAAIGALRYAVEAASDSASAFLGAGRSDSARRAAARARELHVPDQGGELPAIDGLDATAVELTPRESQLLDFARNGLTNAEIADRLVISVRTVETHLYRGMQKLGISDRHAL